MTTILNLLYNITTEQMTDYKLDRKRKLSVDDEKKSYKRNMSEENNLLNSSSRDYRESHIDLDLTNLNYLKEDTASTSYSCKTASKAAKTVNKKDTNIVNRKISCFISNHECLVCSKNFKCKSQLIIHERTLTSEKPYECIVCERRFSRKYTLLTHERTHTGEKPYECNVCGKKFSHNSSLLATSL